MFDTGNHHHDESTCMRSILIFDAHLKSVIGDLVVPHLCRPLARQPGLKVIVPVDDDDGEVGEEDEDVGDDVADDEEGPGVDHVGLTGSQEVHRAGV